nr:sigma-70 family RNA polymerase sigma factor [Sphingobium sp. BHU LFT2]
MRVSDGKAPLKLFLSHRASLIRYARRMAGNTDDAEDIVQEAWLRTTTGAAKLPAAEMMAYLRMTVRNLALNGIRRKRIEARIFEAEGETETVEIPSELPDPEATAISRDEYARIIAAFNGMPENMRKAVEMHRIGGERLKDIAAHLGVSTTTAHTLVINGIERCRAEADRGPA